jgi:hypothetical protein
MVGFGESFRVEVEADPRRKIAEREKAGSKERQ